MREVTASFAPLGHRYTEQELAEMQGETDVRGRGGRGGARAGGPGRQGGPPAFGARGGGPNPLVRRMQFFKEEGALAIIDAGRGDGGTVFVQSAQGVSRDAGPDDGLPQITFAIEHYGRLVRAMEKGVPVTLEMDVKNSFYDDNPQSFNVVGEIPGTDKANEIVMTSAGGGLVSGSRRTPPDVTCVPSRYF